MKRRLLAWLVALLILVSPTGLAAQTKAAEGLTPMDLFGATYNPFFDVVFPDGYTIYRATCVKSDVNLYELSLIAEDTAENVVTFLSNLLGDNAEESIRQNLDNLNNDGIVKIDGSQVGGGPAAVCEVFPTYPNEDYAYVDGYIIRLTKNIEMGKAYDALWEANLNLSAMTGVSTFMTLFPMDGVTFRVYAQDGYAQIDCVYSLKNAAKIKEELIAAFLDAYVKTDDRISLDYGDLHAGIQFSGVQNGVILIEQSLRRTDVSFSEYEASTSLKGIGFEDFRATDAKCSFRDDENSVLLSVSKSEWGENAYESERDAVTFLKKMDGGGLLMVFYDPEIKVYRIVIDDQGKQANFAYYAADATYMDAFGGDDMESAKEIACQVFGKSGEDDALQDAWILFDGYISDVFGMTADELFALDYEPQASAK